MKKVHLLDRTTVCAGLLTVLAISAFSAMAGERLIEGETFKKSSVSSIKRSASAHTYGPNVDVSDHKVLAFFSHGGDAEFGPTPAAKWVKFRFSTMNPNVPLKIYDGGKFLAEVSFPNTSAYEFYEEKLFKLALPACANLRFVASGEPINIDYFLLSDNDQPPAVKLPPPPPTELKEKILKGEYGQCEEIVFATRTRKPEHWYANFGYYCYARERTILNTQGRLMVYNLRTGKLRALLEDLGGSVRDPAVHYDGKTIVFSYRPAKEERYHLYTIQSDGSGFKQLTSGEYDDIEPAWLPDGDIVFVSSRCRRWVNCWLTQVASIYRMKPDGSGIRMLSANIEHDNTPWVLPDGRILYMRWEYVDRRQVTFHHLWTMNQDGTQHQVYQGNTYPNGAYLDAKPVPGTDDVVFADNPGHGQTEHGGALAVVSTKGGPDNRGNIRHICNGTYYDPWAFSKDCFMASDGRAIILANARGAKLKLFSLADNFGRGPEVSRHLDGDYHVKFRDDTFLYEPRPLMPHARERLHADRTDLTSKTGEFYLENVLISRSLPGVKPGTIKKLGIFESLPKPINYTGGMDPLSYSGTFTLTRLLGWVPVEDDGSAYFKAPALKSLFFVAFDGEGRAVKRMQSFTQVMPGERQGCVGCHETKTENTVRRVKSVSKALSRGPSTIDPKGRLFDVPDFPRDIQPILDRACVKCHNPDTRTANVDLSGDHGVMFSMSFYCLTAWNQIYDGRNSDKSDWPPYARGSGGSPLMNKISGQHHGVKLSDRDRTMIMQWLDTSAPYPGTYAALGCGSIGGYHQNAQVVNNDSKRPATIAAKAAIARRCDVCHNGRQRLPHTLSDENGISFWIPDMNDPRLKKTHRYLLFNISRPEKSLFLRAPLAKEAGGLGLKMTKDGKPVFASKDDPDYKLILAMIEDGKKVLDTVKRFDMPGFRPPLPYLREMKRYGVLPWNFDLEHDPVDPYALDRRYWDLDWTQLK